MITQDIFAVRSCCQGNLRVPLFICQMNDPIHPFSQIRLIKIKYDRSNTPIKYANVDRPFFLGYTP